MSDAWLDLLALIILGAPIDYATSLTPNQAAKLLRVMRRRPGYEAH
jgi:hypothetical protein